MFCLHTTKMKKKFHNYVIGNNQKQWKKKCTEDLFGYDRCKEGLFIIFAGKIGVSHCQFYLFYCALTLPLSPVLTIQRANCLSMSLYSSPSHCQVRMPASCFA